MAYFASKFRLAALDQGIDIAGEMDSRAKLCLIEYCSLLLHTLLTEFDVSDGFLMKIYKPGSAPAPASATDESEPVDEHPSDESLGKSPDEVTEVYIVEPLRLTPTVVKFSGTLGSTTRTDLRSSTMAAFAHYVAQATACQYIFADIQGVSSFLRASMRCSIHSMSRLPGSNNVGNTGKLSLTLFDPMTHTVEGFVLRILHESSQT